MSVSWAPFPDVADANFTELTRIPDYWPHLQAMQTNFSVTFMVPDVEIPHAVLRVIYAPNKPTEPTFHQCADVTFVRRGSPPPTGAVLALAAPGIPANARATRAVLVDAGAGALTTAFPLNGLELSGISLLDGLCTALGSTYFSLGLRSSVTGSSTASPPPAVLVSYELGAESPVVVNISLPANDASPPAIWTALAAAPGWPTVSPSGSLVLLGLARTPGNPNTWVYSARRLDPLTGMASAVLASSAPQDTFVNFFAATDAVVVGGGASGDVAMLRFLAGDENSLYALGAQVGSARLDASAGAQPATMTLVAADATAWTLSSLHADPRTGALLALSPGLFGNTSWMLVSIDPATGAVTRVGTESVARPGVFASWYGGNVYGRALTPEGGLLHVMRHVSDGSLALVEVNVLTGALRGAPTLLTGVNGEISLSGFTRVPRD